MSEREVIELAPFRLAAGVSEAELLAASEGLQSSFLARQPGFLRRELLRGPDGGWLDLVYWRDRRSAEDAVRAAAESPVCHLYFKLMAGEAEVNAGDGIQHFERAASYS
jgi:hypothetical protein